MDPLKEQGLDQYLFLLYVVYIVPRGVWEPEWASDLSSFTLSPSTRDAESWVVGGNIHLSEGHQWVCGRVGERSPIF